MSTSSQAAVRSPLMSMTLAPSPAGRTSMLIESSGIGPSFIAAAGLFDGRVLVRVEIHEVCEPCYLEDLPVVIGEAAGSHLPALFARPRHQADDQRYARRVDVADLFEVEEDGGRIRRRGPLVSLGELLFGGGIDVSAEFDDREPVEVPERGPCLIHDHRD